MSEKRKSTKQEQARGEEGGIASFGGRVQKKDRKRKTGVTSKTKVRRAVIYKPIDDDIDGAIDPCR